MELLTAAISDAGRKKKVNQDAVMLKVARTEYGRIGLAVICDGMGGLQKGELASLTLLNEIEKWFWEVLPGSLSEGDRDKAIYDGLLAATGKADWKLKQYIAREGVQLGTTIGLLLIIENQYYVFHVGDTRVYLHNGETLVNLTKDHTLVQREIDDGRMTEEEAEASPDRSVLLQCVGASPNLEPDFFTDYMKRDTSFIVCSDGFRHMLTHGELWQRTAPEKLLSEREMEAELKDMVKAIKTRKEDDNISAVLIKAF